MMNRRPEPELMVGQHQVAAYAAADFGAGDQALIDRLMDLFPSGLGDRLVDLGCGPGNITFRLAAAVEAAQVLGIDGSEPMLALARVALGQHPDLGRRVSFACHILPDRTLPQGFSAVVSNSLLHHLHEPQVLWAAVRQLGQAGAAVYIKDLRRPATPEAVLALRERYLADAPAVLQRDYVASLHAAFTAAEVRQQLQRAGLADQLQVAEVDDRYLEVWGRLA
jgi:trans-aconitate 2-methyltransferase